MVPRAAAQRLAVHRKPEEENAEAGDDLYAGQLEPMPALSELPVFRSAASMLMVKIGWVGETSG